MCHSYFSCTEFYNNFNIYKNYNLAKSNICNCLKTTNTNNIGIIAGVQSMKLNKGRLAITTLVHLLEL